MDSGYVAVARCAEDLPGVRSSFRVRSMTGGRLGCLDRANDDR